MPPSQLILFVNRLRLCGCRLCCVHAHLLAGLVIALELHYAVDLCKERIVTALSHVLTRVDPGSALTRDDRSRIPLFAVISFYTKVLRLAVSSVPRTANAFF